MYNSRKDKKSYDLDPKALADLTKKFESMTSRHDKPLSPITIKNYVAKLNKLSCLVRDKCWDGEEAWLDSPTKVIEALKKTNPSGLKDFISPVIRLLKMKNADQKIIETYQKNMSEFKNSEYAVRKQNKATPKEIENSLSLPDIIRKIDEYKPDDEMSLINKLICSLYFQGSVVFRNDLPLMKLVSTSKKVKDMNPQFNYITLDKNGTPIDIVMKAYKSSPTYGTQKFPVTAPIRDLLKQYLKMYGKQAGDYLFVDSKGIPFTKDNFRDIISNATESVLGKRMNINLIRKIQVTDWLNQGAHSIQETEDDARRYLHSSKMHAEYLAKGLKEDDE